MTKIQKIEMKCGECGTEFRVDMSMRPVNIIGEQSWAGLPEFNPDKCPSCSSAFDVMDAWMCGAEMG